MAISRKQRARCPRDIAVDYNVYSLLGSMARTAPHTSQWHISRRQRGSSRKSRIGLATCVRYAYACISRDTAVCLNLAKQHHSAWTSFSSILSKMIWIYQRFGRAVSFDRNIAETWNLKCNILITFFIQISNKNGEKRSQIENWKIVQTLIETFAETWNLKCNILITFFIQISNEKWWKTIPNWKLKNSFRHLLLIIIIPPPPHTHTHIYLQQHGSQLSG